MCLSINTKSVTLQKGNVNDIVTDIRNLLSLVLDKVYDMFNCAMITTKAPNYAIDRIAVLKDMGFELSEEYLVGHNKRVYGGYWIKRK